VLFVDNQDAAEWATRLQSAQVMRKAAEHAEADAKGALDALRTVSRPGETEYVEVPGLNRVIRFSVNRGKKSPDMAQIANDYKRAGARPPMRYGEPTIRVSLVKKPEGEH
jgi:hypothetical protein